AFLSGRGLRNDSITLTNIPNTGRFVAIKKEEGAVAQAKERSTLARKFLRSDKRKDKLILKGEEE
ncbi:hypothetical protein DVA81_19840, partial [Acinetobacter baumannii]